MSERKQFRIVGNKTGKLQIDKTQLHAVVGDTTDEIGDELATNEITNYRSEFESDGFIYSGYLINNTPEITRTKDGTKELAQGVTNLETDWANRLTLIYE